ncbi:MAG: tetratricopeptide repeat protein [Opitutaceae bacterium]|nr:tetratricopeptide repeat protein [Opitutaceae bacterium]
MSKSAPASQEAKAPVVPFDEALHAIWQKNKNFIITIIIAALVAMLGYYGFEYFQHQKETSIAAAYAAAGASSAKLKTFADEHPGHVLGGLARLRLADEAFAAKNYTEAAAIYQEAADALGAGPFAGRARLGAAVAKIHAGQTASGETALKQLSSDGAQLQDIRAEASYHLGTLALAAGRPDDALKSFDLVSAIAPSSLWSRQAMFRRSLIADTAPAVPAADAAPVAPAADTAPTQAADAAPAPAGAPSIQF